MNAADDQETTQPALPRWWRRRPGAGVAVSIATGAVAMWISAALAPSGQQPVDAVVRLVSLPIALLLPAGALAAALIGWQAWRAAEGAARARLALPALAAVSVNALAIGMFARLVAGLVLR
jgi:hypothetical protein